MLNLSIILTTLAAVSLAAKPKPKHKPSCTITSTLEQSECCPQIPARTKYAFTQCGGCALVTETVPLACFAPCTATPTVDRALTTTVTECDQVMSILPVTTKKGRHPKGGYVRD